MILDTYTTFEELVETVNDISDIKIVIDGHKKHRGIRLKDKHVPKSVNEHEFNYLHDFIVRNNLKYGYELATGVGISTLCSGIAMNKTNGILLTLDNYIEEGDQSCQIADNHSCTFNDSDSYKLLTTMIDNFDLNKVISINVGNSPEDTVKILTPYKSKIDYVFLDCPKCDEDFKRDFTAVWDFINKDRYAIFVHDTHTFTNKSFELVKEITGVKMNLIHEFYKNTDHYSKRTYPLAIITNII